MLKIRLTRLGDKGSPFYRIVVAENSASRDGKCVDTIGTYDPKLTDYAGLKIDKEKAMEWLGKGAQPTDTTRVLLQKAGVLEATKIKKEKK